MRCYWKGKYYLVSFSREVEAEKTDSGFPKTFSGYLFVFVEHLCKLQPQNENKNSKNYILILAICSVNYWNWLDALHPLS